METDVNKSVSRSKNRWEHDTRNDMKKLKIQMCLAASKTTIIGNYMFRRAKDSTIEVVAPIEEEDDVMQ